jgi:hypothetical protein
MADICRKIVEAGRAGDLAPVGALKAQLEETLGATTRVLNESPIVKKAV